VASGDVIVGHVVTRAWVVPVRLVLGGLMVWGGVMHFTVDQKIWRSSLLDAMADSKFLWREIGIVNLVAGIALLTGRGVPLAAAVLAPITFNIFLFHAFRLDPFGLTIGVPVAALNAALLFGIREAYSGLL
jgi:putative oxidoreductase